METRHFVSLANRTVVKAFRPSCPNGKRVFRGNDQLAAMSKKKKRSVGQPQKSPEPSGKPKEPRYVLRLFVTGLTERSTRAIAAVRRICEEQLEGRYDLEVIDVSQQPELARSNQIVATPTLVRKLPLPLRRLIGDMTNTERILAGLDLKPKE